MKKIRLDDMITLDCFVEIILFLKLNKIFELRILSRSINDNVITSDYFIELFMKTRPLIFEFYNDLYLIDSLKKQWKLYKNTHKLQIVAHPIVCKKRVYVNREQLCSYFNKDLLISKDQLEHQLNKRFEKKDGVKILCNLFKHHESNVGWVCKMHLDDSYAKENRFTSLVCDLHLVREKIKEFLKMRDINLCDLKFSTSFTCNIVDDVPNFELNNLLLQESEFKECKIIKIFY